MWIVWTDAMRSNCLVRAGRAILAAAMLCLALLRFANPQWHRYVYMFQAYAWPGDEDGWIGPPDGHNGEWRTWHPNGQLWDEIHYRDGRVHGKSTRWRRRGTKEHECNYVAGEPSGTYVGYDETGRKAWEGHYFTSAETLEMQRLGLTFRRNVICTWTNERHERWPEDWLDFDATEEPSGETGGSD